LHLQAYIVALHPWGRAIQFILSSFGLCNPRRV